MPLSDHVSGVSQPPELVGEGGEVGVQPCWLEGLEGALLPAGVEGVEAGEEGGAGGRAHLPDTCQPPYCPPSPAGCRPGTASPPTWPATPGEEWAWPRCSTRRRSSQGRPPG